MLKTQHTYTYDIYIYVQAVSNRPNTSQGKQFSQARKPFGIILILLNGDLRKKLASEMSSEERKNRGIYFVTTENLNFYCCKCEATHSHKQPTSHSVGVHFFFLAILCSCSAYFKICFFFLGMSDSVGLLEIQCYFHSYSNYGVSQSWRMT